MTSSPVPIEEMISEQTVFSKCWFCWFTLSEKLLPHQKYPKSFLCNRLVFRLTQKIIALEFELSSQTSIIHSDWQSSDHPPIFENLKFQTYGGRRRLQKIVRRRTKKTQNISFSMNFFPKNTLKYYTLMLMRNTICIKDRKAFKGILT